MLFSEFVSEFQERQQRTTKIDSVEDMKRFMQDYPEFRKLSGNVSKHVTLLSELSRVVDKESLMSLSEVEQELAVTEDHSAATRVRFYDYFAEFADDIFFDASLGRVLDPQRAAHQRL